MDLDGDDYIRIDEFPKRRSGLTFAFSVPGACVLLLGCWSTTAYIATKADSANYKSARSLRLEIDTRPICKRGVWCPIYDEEEHAERFSHPCSYKSKGTEKIAPGTRMHLDKDHPCANFDEVHRKRYTHPILEEDLGEIDETPDDLDAMVVSSPDEVAVAAVGETFAVTEEEALEAKAAASEAMSAGDFEKAAQLFSKAVQGSPSAPVLANRANCLLKLKRPNAAVADCKKALGINPNSAKAFKAYGKALCMLGQWEEANKQLGEANSIDGDDDSEDLQKQIQKKLAKIKKNEEIRAKQAAAAAAAATAAPTEAPAETAEAATPASLSPKGGFAGAWQKDGQIIGTITADNSMVVSIDGAVSSISIDGDKISIDEARRGRLEDKRISWSDGSIWERLQGSANSGGG